MKPITAQTSQLLSKIQAQMEENRKKHMRRMALGKIVKNAQKS